MFPRFPSRSSLPIACLLFANLAHASWELIDQPHPTETGRIVEILRDSKKVARFVYGTGQVKPYLHVFADDGVTLLTKGAGGTYSHHRGIFIGWNEIQTGSTSNDLWHMDLPGPGGTPGSMRVISIDRMDARPDSALLVAQIEWRAGTTGTGTLILNERRTIVVSKPHGSDVQIDCHFELHAAQTLTLNGDLQHAGVHYRPPEEVATRSTETSYLSSPDGVVAGSNLKWVRLLFPIGTRWFTSVEMNALENPVDELSMRDYGRFGYFFKRTLQTGQALNLAYRFRVVESAAPATPPTQSGAQIAQSRAECDALYQDFLAFQSSDADGDGQTNAQEMKAGTNPFLSESVFKVLQTGRNGNGTLFCDFPWFAVKTYRIWRSDNLLNGWTEVLNPQFSFPSTGVGRWSDSLPVPNQRFYRVTVE